MEIREMEERRKDGHLRYLRKRKLKYRLPSQNISQSYEREPTDNNVVPAFEYPNV